MPIFTDSNGRPIECPEAPAPGADIEARIAYMRAKCAYNDAIASRASAAFAAAFSKAVRK